MVAAARFHRLSIALCTLAIAALCPAVTTAHAGSALLRVDVAGGLLTLRAEGSPLGEVAAAIGEQAGFEVIVIGTLATTVSASLTGVPVWEALERLLGDTSRVVFYDRQRKGRERAMVQLWLLGPGTGAAAVAADGAPGDVAGGLQDPDARTRSQAVLRLAGRGGSAQTLDDLVRMLRGDADPLVRSRAATALGSLGDPAAVPALAAALGDEHGSVRVAAAHALGEIGGDPATRELGTVLLHGVQTRERVIAAWGLGKQGTPLARQFLDAVADDPDKQVRAASQARGRSNVLEIPAGTEHLGSEDLR